MVDGRMAVDILSCSMLNGLLRLHRVDNLPLVAPDELPEIVSELLREGMKYSVPRSFPAAHEVRRNLVISTSRPDDENVSLNVDTETETDAPPPAPAFPITNTASSGTERETSTLPRDDENISPNGDTETEHSSETGPTPPAPASLITNKNDATPPVPASPITDETNRAPSPPHSKSPSAGTGEEADRTAPASSGTERETSTLPRDDENISPNGDTKTEHSSETGPTPPAPASPTTEETNRTPLPLAPESPAHQSSAGQLDAGENFIKAFVPDGLTGSGSHSQPGPAADPSVYSLPQQSQRLLARLQHVDLDVIARPGAPPLIRDDPMREWERRQAGRKNAVNPYPQLEYLQQQAEMAATGLTELVPPRTFSARYNPFGAPHIRSNIAHLPSMGRACAETPHIQCAAVGFNSASFRGIAKLAMAFKGLRRRRRLAITCQERPNPIG
ncbi:hypothetical protein DFH08DRAFT_1090221 [Mycena albidolilacea]|uniref:Uncharacterized protein n=1 Tax=Mycena albidolilacea TaxID=1033008 RepID=A0AAD6YXX9_9AGAR|nr:hypothetical protein DFH08DRAFT_1090221 [Mycena albidolilacea]